MPQSSPSPSPLATMPPSALLFADLKPEMMTTRRMLERVPNGKDDWRPHAKSRTLDELATHVAQLPGLGILILTKDEHEGSSTPPQPKPADSAARLKIFDEVSTELQRLVKELTWDRAMSRWILKFRGNVALDAPRAMALRTAMIAHIAHHRAQLGVYLRLLDVPLPGSYGPSADESPPSR